MGNTASGKPRTGFEWVTFFGFETTFALSKDDGRKLWREVDKNQVGFLMGADQCSVLIQHKLAEKLLALMVKSEHGKDRIAHKRKVQKKFNADRWERWLERAKKLILEDLGDAQGMAWFLRAAKYHDDLLTEENVSFCFFCLFTFVVHPFLSIVVCSCCQRWLHIRRRKVSQME